LKVVSALSLGTLVSNLKSVALTVFELLALTPIDRPLRANTHTHTQTNIERTHYLRHSLRSLGGDNNNNYNNNRLMSAYIQYNSTSQQLFDCGMSVSVAILSVLYTVSGKKSLQYFMCNLNKFKGIFIIFSTNHPETPLY